MQKTLLMAAILATTMAAGRVQAQQDPVKLAVLNDQSSSFAMLGGTEVVDAVRLAIKDFGGQVLGKPIGFVTADHQNKPDIGMGIARE
jgi:branched-chain amino acid transport system substrate-binding protein